MSEKPAWKYAIKQVVAGRTIVAQKQASKSPARNIYTIRYPCCPMLVDVQQQSLDKALKENSPALCPSCRRKGLGMKIKPPKPKETEPTVALLRKWPVPPSIR